jgi:hypothetical protein
MRFLQMWFLVPVLTLLFWAAVMIAMSRPSRAQPAPECAPMSDMIAELASAKSEYPVMTMGAPQNALIVFVNDETQTWTLVVWGSIQACVVSRGTGVGYRPA